jgi:protein-tyrosine phosphatase
MQHTSSHTCHDAIESNIVEDTGPVQIDKGLYIGSLTHAQSKRVLEHLGATHILTCIKGMESWLNGVTVEEADSHSKIVHKFVEVDDLDTEDFARDFDFCANFIADALNQENNVILVHCQAGISRSCTAILAYLIKYRGMNLDEGLAFISQRKGDVNPNEGFKRQLNRYYRKIHQQQSLGQEDLSSEELVQQRLQRIRGSDTHTDTKYCKMCRCQLFNSADLVPHEGDRGKKDFSFKKIKKDRVHNVSGGSKCSSYFIDRMDWMGDMGDVNEGRICCPRGHQLGTFIWSGMQCSCGVWVRPAFAILKNRVD